MGIKDFICGKCFHKSNDTKFVVAIRQCVKFGGRKTWVGVYNDGNADFDIYITMKKKEAR